MTLTALLLAGGKGTRMSIRQEKPLIKVGGKPMIQHVLKALKNAEKVDQIVVAVSKHTPETAKFIEAYTVGILETPGEGYIHDIEYAVTKLNLDKVLTISADLPLVTGATIDSIIERYTQSHKPALTVAVPMETKEKLGLKAEHLLETGDKRLTPAGINIIEGKRILEGELEEEIFVLDRYEAAVNVNTRRERRIAESLFKEQKDKTIQHEEATMISDLETITHKLRILLEKAVKNNLAEGLLLSGGLDTSIIAALAARLTSLKAVTVAFENAPAPDVEYAVLMAQKLGLNHSIHTFNQDELHQAIPVVIKTLNSFDPMEIRNSVATHIALKAAKEKGIHNIMTGDGADELFAGYSFLFDLKKEELNSELKKLWSVMEFSSVPLANALNMEARLPYLSQDLKDFATNLDPRLKIRHRKKTSHGKWILRKAFQETLPNKIAWRAKTPIEQGSGTTILPRLYDQKISDEEFKEKRSRYLAKDRVTIRDKEQLYYYEAYRAEIGVPHPEEKGEKTCPYCHSNIPENATYCRTCGAHPV